jgi:hypothetical protein
MSAAATPNPIHPRPFDKPMSPEILGCWQINPTELGTLSQSGPIGPALSDFRKGQSTLRLKALEAAVPTQGASRPNLIEAP